MVIFALFLAKSLKVAYRHRAKFGLRWVRVGKVFLRDGGLGKMGCYGFERFLRFFSVFVPKVIEIFRE